MKTLGSKHTEVAGQDRILGKWPIVHGRAWSDSNASYHLKSEHHFTRRDSLLCHPGMEEQLTLKSRVIADLRFTLCDRLCSRSFFSALATFPDLRNLMRNFSFSVRKVSYIGKR